MTANRERDRRGLWLSLLALAVVAFTLHARPLVRGEAFGAWSIISTGAPWGQSTQLPNRLADTDPVMLEHPEGLHLHRTGARWDPTRGLGEPVGLASWPTLTHPLARPLYRALPPTVATVVVSLVHVLLGGVLCLLHLRWRGAGAAAALAGAIAFELSPLFTVWLSRPWITGAMPLGIAALWAAEALARRPGPRPAGALALAFGGLLLCVIPQFGVLLGLAAWTLAGAGAAAGARVRTLAWAGGALVVGALIGAPRLVPLWAFVQASSREAIPWAEWHQRTAELRPDQLVTLLLPDAWGHPMRGLFATQRNVYDNFQELRIYLGLPVLVLALAGAMTVGVRRYAAGAALALALATATPLAYVLWRLPGFAGSSATRSLWLLPFLVAPLVAGGARALLRGERGPARAAVVALVATGLLSEWLGGRSPQILGVFSAGPVQGGAPAGVHLQPAAAWPGPRWQLSPTLGPLLLAGATAACAVVALRLARARRLACALLAGLAAGELLREGHVYLSTSPRDAYYPETPATRAVVDLAGQDRVLVRPPIPPSVTSPFGVRAVGSYGPLHSDRLVRLLRALDPAAIPVRQLVWPAELPAAWRDALSVRAVLDAPGNGPTRRDDLLLVHDGPDARVWAAPGALPRARLHARDAVLEVVDLAGALAAATDPTFDPRLHVVLETGQAGRRPTSTAAPAPLDAAVDEPERVVVRVDAPAGGVLVLADAYAPGWTCATGDGAPLPMLPASVALRGVELPAGFRGEVVFSYSPPGARAGLALGLLGLALAAAAARPRG